jgi:hypothetical protein
VPSDTALTSDIAAEQAYTFLFLPNNEKRLPAGDLFVAVMIYGPKNGMMASHWGFVFERNAAGQWQPRNASKAVLDTIMAAMGMDKI